MYYYWDRRNHNESLCVWNGDGDGWQKKMGVMFWIVIVLHTKKKRKIRYTRISKNDIMAFSSWIFFGAGREGTSWH